MEGLEELLEFVVSEGRVYPKQMKWNELWALLPDKRRSGHGWNPLVPLILAAWWDTPNESKRERFLTHIRYAYQRGALENVSSFIMRLKNEDWHYEFD